MADTRLLCVVVIAVLLAAVSTAERPDDGQENTVELRQLLGAMKRYLHDQTDKQKLSILNAHDDVRTVYNATVSPGTVQAAQNAGTGYWTDWINADPIMQYGTGEFEECSRIWLEQGRSGKCYLDCSTPLAAQYSLVYKQSIATWTDIENCVGRFDSHNVTSCGFKCFNNNARYADKSKCRTDECGAFGLNADCTRCPDVRVKFFCMGQKPNADAPCPHFTRRGRSSLRSALTVFGTDEEKRDVIANILYEVEDVLEPSN